MTKEYYIEIDYELYEPLRQRFKTRESFFRADGKSDSAQLTRAIINRWYDLRTKREFDTGERLILQSVEIARPAKWTNVRYSVSVRYRFTSSRNPTNKEQAFEIVESVEPFLVNFSGPNAYDPPNTDRPFMFYLRTREYTMRGVSKNLGFIDQESGAHYARVVTE